MYLKYPEVPLVKEYFRSLMVHVRIPNLLNTGKNLFKWIINFTFETVKSFFELKICRIGSIVGKLNSTY
jgi:hypothetical protein